MAIPVRRLTLFTSILIVFFCTSGPAQADTGRKNSAATGSTDNNTPLPPSNIVISPLTAKYQQLKKELAGSIFSSPILISSTSNNDYDSAEVYALLNAPFSALTETLSQPQKWCELAILHSHIKSCLYNDTHVTLFVGQKQYATPEQASPISYVFAHPNNSPQQLDITLTADEGPLSTSDYRIRFQAVPIDDEHSFVYFQYQYHAGFLANIAMKSYLATLGRHKVGFTTTNTSSNANTDETAATTTYINGARGVIERNIIRYIFAIQSVLETRHLSENVRYPAQLKSWYARVQQHPEQFNLGLSLDEYNTNKLRELKNQQAAQAKGHP
ncbi:MAG: hypothetical protein COB30_020610 [Ectothiorhodospiraceae bacterium]|nr:hypothetical protein [Ectothiorhodospiraceae bacterium]